MFSLCFASVIDCLATLASVLSPSTTKSSSSASGMKIGSFFGLVLAD